MLKAKVIFKEIQVMLLSVDHPQRCYCDALVTLDQISSKVQIKQGELKDEQAEKKNR